MLGTKGLDLPYIGDDLRIELQDLGGKTLEVLGLFVNSLFPHSHQIIDLSVLNDSHRSRLRVEWSCPTSRPAGGSTEGNHSAC